MKKNEEFSRKSTHFLKSACLALCLVSYGGSAIYAASTYAEQTTLTVRMNNRTVKDVFSYIEKNSEFIFVYHGSNINLNKKVNVDVNNQTVEAILKKMFEGTDIEYIINDRQIIVRKNETNKKQVAVVAPQQEKKITVTGNVKDATGEPLIGVNVMVKGTTMGNITDANGNFSLSDVAPNAVISVSYIGYKTQEIALNGKTAVNVILSEDSEALDEVVVIGYGTQKKADLSGAVATVPKKVLENRPVLTVGQALQGSVANLTVSIGSGQATDSPSFNIRGTTSINGGGPLVLIDNVPGDIDMLNPEDIESVSVLKDAASAAIYGARAAFGVILVTTKKAKKGDGFHVNYNNNFGFQSSINRPEQADGLEWMQAYLDGEFNAGKYYTGQDIKTWMNYLTEYRKNPGKFQTTGDGVYVDPETGLNYYLNEKDLYANMLDDYGFLQAHNVSLSGGTDKLAYRLSLGYNSEQGILITDKDRYKRLSGSAYISAEITSWLTQSVDIRYAQSDKNMPVTSDKTGLYDMRLPVVYPEGSLTLPDGTSLMTNTPSNVLRMATDNNTIRDNARILSKTVLRPLKGLEVAFEYTFDKTWSNQNVNKASIDYTTVELAKIQTATTSSLETTHQSTDYNAINLYANYRYSWNDTHNLSLMGGFNQESSDWKKLYTYSYDMINEKYPSHSTATGENKVITDDHRVYTVRGAFYRVNYDYKGKYLFETNGRYDGSSKFPKKNRFGFFPSVSVGWNIARENFMKPVAGDWLSDLKLRGTWGQIGNQGIDPYKFVPTMSQVEKKDVAWLVNGAKPLTLNAPGLVSDSFTWETVETLDFGFDITALNGRLQSTFDWYRRDTKDMLAPGAELPSVVGASAPLQNTADLRTKGWELSLTWRDRIGAWGYNVGFNLYDSKTVVTKYHNESKIILKSDGTNNYYEGYEIGSIWGYVTDGYYTADDFEDTNTWKLKEGVVTVDGVSPRPGDIKYQNLRDDGSSTNRIDTGDGTFDNPGDRKIIGNNSLRLQYGINLGVNYKGFDLSVLLQGVGKRDVWISDARRWPFNSGQFGSLFKDQLDYWKPVDSANGDWTAANPNAEYFRIYGQGNNSSYNTRAQTKYLMNGSYLRVKNVTLSYNFPKSWLAPITLTSLKAFVSCENLHTFTKLMKGYDPERLSWGYPFYRTISFGFNVTL